MWETMKYSAKRQWLSLYGYISITASGRGSNNVLIEREWDEDDQGEKIDDCRDCSHCFWNLWLPRLGHIPPFETCIDEDLS